VLDRLAQRWQIDEVGVEPAVHHRGDDGILKVYK
jgi:hypothetical protein